MALKVSPLMLLPPLIFLGLGALFMTGLGRDNPDNLPTTLAGRPAPEVPVEPLANLPIFTDTDLAKSEVKLVNFWASWCAPCRVEHPNLAELEALGLPIYGINYKDNPLKAEKFLNDLGNPYAAVGTDEKGRVAIEWGVYGVPETFIINAKGEVILRHAGPITGRIMQSTILPAIQKAQSNP